MRGIVFDDANNNNQPDQGEGLPDALVRITHTAVGFTVTMSTEVDGVFDIDGVPVGEYAIAVTPPTGYGTAECDPVTVQPDQTASVEPIAAHKVTTQDNKISLPSIMR